MTLILLLMPSMTLVFKGQHFLNALLGFFGIFGLGIANQNFVVVDQSAIPLSLLFVETGDQQTAAGLLDEPVAHILGRFTAAPTLQEAVAHAVYVQENSPELLELKQNLFSRLDACAPPTAATS